MSLIAEITNEDATGEVADIYRQAESVMGYVPNSLRMHSINPFMLRQLWEYIGSVMQHPSLSGELFTCIRMMVSVDQRCQYCIDFNQAMLTDAYGWDVDTVSQMKNNPEAAPLDDKEKALLLFTLKAVGVPNYITEEDTDALRKLGCTDLEIYDALTHGARQVAGDILLSAFKVKKD